MTDTRVFQLRLGTSSCDTTGSWTSLGWWQIFWALHHSIFPCPKQKLSSNSLIFLYLYSFSVVGWAFFQLVTEDRKLDLILDSNSILYLVYVINSQVLLILIPKHFLKLSLFSILLWLPGRNTLHLSALLLLRLTGPGFQFTSQFSSPYSHTPVIHRQPLWCAASLLKTIIWVSRDGQNMVQSPWHH